MKRFTNHKLELVEISPGALYINGEMVSLKDCRMTVERAAKEGVIVLVASKKRWWQRAC